MKQESKPKPDQVWYVDGAPIDLSSFLNHHPGGRFILEATRGHEIGWLIPPYHAVTLQPKKMIERFRVDLPHRPIPDYPKCSVDDPLYKELREMILHHFEGRSHKAPWVALLYCLFIFFVLEVPALCFWVTGSLMGGLLAGIFHWMAFIGITHDGSHLAFSKKPLFNRLAMACSLPFVSNPLSWILQHVVYHHSYTNDVTADVDTWVYLPFARTFRSQAWLPSMRYATQIALPFQILLTTFGLSILYPIQVLIFPLMKLRFVSVFATGEIPSSYIRYLWEGPLGLLLSMACLVYPVFLFPTWNLASQILHGLAPFLTMSIIFFTVTQVSHIHEDCEPAKDATWAENMVKTSYDYCGDSFLWSVLTGGLNAQSLHHLFPTIHSWHYAELYPKYREILIKHGVELKSSPSLLSGFRRYRNHMLNVNFKE